MWKGGKGGDSCTSSQNIGAINLNSKLFGVLVKRICQNLKKDLRFDPTILILLSFPPSLPPLIKKKQILFQIKLHLSRCSIHLNLTFRQIEN